jgi:hypothetical protein
MDRAMRELMWAVLDVPGATGRWQPLPLRAILRARYAPFAGRF